MNQSYRTKVSAIVAVSALAAVLLFPVFRTVTSVNGQTDPVPTPTPEPEFDREAAVAKIRESIKGREDEPAEKVFKNIQSFKGFPAGRIVAIMGGGFSRALGVNCTHCHTPDDWASDAKQPKLIARDMRAMTEKIDNELLKEMKSLGGRQAIVSCATCHRGDLKPATSLPRN